VTYGKRTRIASGNDLPAGRLTRVRVRYRFRCVHAVHKPSGPGGAGAGLAIGE